MKMVAAAGDIDVTTLKDSINLLAKLNITHTADRVMITAKEEVVINGGGSYVKYNAGGIEHGTNGIYVAYAATHSLPGPKNRSVDLQNSGAPTPFDREVVFHHVDDQNSAAAKQMFKLDRDGASAAGPVTGSDGSTQMQRSDGPEFYKVRWLGRAK
jgi:type VI secretion system secreted protein VgrG